MVRKGNLAKCEKEQKLRNRHFCNFTLALEASLVNWSHHWVTSSFSSSNIRCKKLSTSPWLVGGCGWGHVSCCLRCTYKRGKENKCNNLHMMHVHVYLPFRIGREVKTLHFPLVKTGCYEGVPFLFSQHLKGLSSQLKESKSTCSKWYVHVHTCNEFNSSCKFIARSFVDSIFSSSFLFSSSSFLFSSSSCGLEEERERERG